MLGFLPLAALAAADHDLADHLVSGNLCISRHRLVQVSKSPDLPTRMPACSGMRL